MKEHLTPKPFDMGGHMDSANLDGVPLCPGQGDDMWTDAKLPTVLAYMCKNRHTFVPDEVRDMLMRTARAAGAVL